MAIVGEPTGMHPAIAEKGLMVLDGQIKGVSGHAARNEGVNAIYRAMEVVNTLRNLTFDKVSDMLGPIKITVSQIEAGTQHNVLPDLCLMNGARSLLVLLASTLRASAWSTLSCNASTLSKESLSARQRLAIRH